jgi:hypothetical protein
VCAYVPYVYVYMRMYVHVVIVGLFMCLCHKLTLIIAILIAYRGSATAEDPCRSGIQRRTEQVITVEN